MSALARSSARPPQPPLSDGVHHIRPMSTRITVATNALQITSLPRHTFFQYDVISTTNPDEPPLPKRRNYEIIDRLQTENAAIFNPRPVYDGRKIMFSTRQIPDTPFTVRFPGRTRAKVFTVLIRRAGVVRPDTITNALMSQGGSRDEYLSSLALLQLIVRQAPNMRHGFPPDSRSFFISEGANDLRCGLTAWRGFFQSVRPTVGRLLLNIDSTNALVYTPGPLINAMMSWLGVRDPARLGSLSRSDIQKLRAFLKGVYVTVSVGRSRPRPKPITDLIPEAGLEEFDNADGQRVTVQHHFQTKYNVRVRWPRALGVRIGRTAVIPAEFVNIESGQVYRKKIPPQIQSDFLRFSTKRPRERWSALMQAIEADVFDHRNSDYVREAGMVINPAPLHVNGSVIVPPEIEYGHGRIMRIPPRAGAWNVVNQTFHQPGRLSHWAVIYYTRDVDDVRRFVTSLVANMRSLVVQNETPPLYSGNILNPLIPLQQACADIPPTTSRPFFLVLLPENAPDCRQAVKHWGDVTIGITTQCVRSGKWEGSNDQYRNNVALKINTRMGGLNSHVPRLANIFSRSMIVGADVGHPAPGNQHRPSVAGVVASVGPFPNQMIAMNNVQEPRTEVIQSLDEMISFALEQWKKCRSEGRAPNDPPMPPTSLIFYRDGISEGEFDTVAPAEIEKIKDGFRKAGVPERIWPKIVFIVVGKRHHVRFFPVRREDEDRSGNCPAGLLVDTAIKSPQYEDFYLQSHAGLLGTSRPSHYVVLRNDPNMPLEEIQQITFNLCHVYASATRSVSIPAPVYYADKLCGRLEFHCQDGASFSDTASNVTGQPAQFDLNYWKQTFKYAHHRLTWSPFYL